MVNFDDLAIDNIEKAEKIIDQNDYDDALLMLDDALKYIEKALGIAKKRNFKEDEERLDNREKDIRKRKNFYQIEKGRFLLRKSAEKLKKHPEACEKELYDILAYLQKLTIESEDLKQVVEECKTVIIQSKLEQAKISMDEAEKLYDTEEYYDARSIYKKNQEYLGKIEDETGKFNVTSMIDDIRKLKTMCNENMDSCNSQLFHLPDAPGRKLLKTKDLPGFIFPQHSVDPFLPNITVIDKLKDTYEVLEHIGGGGFADVYKVKSKAENRIVALKIPRELTSSSEEVFFKEIQNWEQLKHRNIVRLIRPRVTPVPHLVIEYINGGTLHDLLQHPRIGIKDACRIVFDVATGLEYAHSKLIIHCDLKPKNILINDIGEAKITDFGIAKTVMATTDGSRGHTLRYASPEQLTGNPEAKTDVYQLGLVLYQIITGINPFDIGNMVEVEHAIRNKIPEPPSMFNNDAKPLDELVMSCLAKNVDERPTIRNVRDSLYDYMKRCHGESLHITKDNKSFIKIAVECAFYAAKHGEISECIAYIKSVKEKTVEAKLRKQVEILIRQLENMEEDMFGRIMTEITY